jgi:hypothetical protein
VKKRLTSIGAQRARTRVLLGRELLVAEEDDAVLAKARCTSPHWRLLIALTSSPALPRRSRR